MNKLATIAFSSLFFFLGYTTQIQANEEVNTDVISFENSDVIDQEVFEVEETNDNTTVIDTVDESILTTQEVLNGWQEENTKYYVDGKAVNGVQTIDKDVYYFENETLNPYTGFVKNTDNRWIFVRDGKSDWTFTGVAKSKENGKWYHADKGVLNWNFTGISKSVENGKWYFSRKGALDWSFTGVAKSIQNGKWYHVKKGELDWSFTGISKSIENGKWYFSKNGKLDWTFTGVAKSVENGKWYHSKKGALDWSFTGFSKSIENNKWYYSKKGALDWSFTGVAKSIENNRLYYAKKGALDWSYTGLAKDANKNYHYVKGGAVMTSGNAKIDKAVSWALTIAMNDYYGYSQARRMSGRDFDCSSFVYYSLLNAGYNTKQLGTYAFTTHNIANILKTVGFKTYNYSQIKNSLKPGDLLLSDGHVEIYIGNGKTVGAHYPDARDTYGDKDGKEVSVENLNQFFLNYTRVLRL